MQEKVLEFWSPAPLPEGDAGKDAATSADLKKPEVVDLEVSSDSSVGSESDVEVVGATVPPTRPCRDDGGGGMPFGRSRPPRPA